jgi:hypothetical protein
MSAGRITWQLLRASRWVLWLAFLGYCFYVHIFREGQYNQFGHLPTSTELTIFGLANAAVFVGLLEMMMRERAGIPRPSYGSSRQPDSQLRDRA